MTLLFFIPMERSRLNLQNPYFFIDIHIFRKIAPVPLINRVWSMWLLELDVRDSIFTSAMLNLTRNLMILCYWLQVKFSRKFFYNFASTHKKVSYLEIHSDSSDCPPSSSVAYWIDFFKQLCNPSNKTTPDYCFGSVAVHYKYGSRHSSPPTLSEGVRYFYRLPHRRWRIFTTSDTEVVHLLNLQHEGP